MVDEPAAAAAEAAAEAIAAGRPMPLMRTGPPARRPCKLRNQISEVERAKSREMSAHEN